MAKLVGGKTRDKGQEQRPKANLLCLPSDLLSSLVLTLLQLFFLLHGLDACPERRALIALSCLILVSLSTTALCASEAYFMHPNPSRLLPSGICDRLFYSAQQDKRRMSGMWRQPPSLRVYSLEAIILA